MTPFPIFHALHGLVFEPTWAGVEATDFDAVPDTKFSIVGISESKDSVCGSLIWGSPVLRFYPSCFCYGACWEPVAFFNLPEVRFIGRIKHGWDMWD